MHRWYRATHYAERIQLIRDVLPDAGIGADVIAGFPGETNDDFRSTVEFIERLPFTYLHVFAFSARPGTKAADLGEPVRPEIIRQRTGALRALSLQKSAAFRDVHAGRSLRALTLKRGGDTWTEALTGNYLKVRIAGRHSANLWYQATVQPEEAQVYAGEPCGSGEPAAMTSEIVA